MQETQVRFLIWEDPTYRGTTKQAHVPVLQSPGAAATEARALQQEKPRQWEAHALQLESCPRLLHLKKRLSSDQDPAQP